MASLRFWVAWCLALAAAASTFAQSSAPIDGKRVALVIGNGAYGAGRLNNPALDARAMAATLRSLGFEVGTGEDMTYQGMRRAVADFGERMAGAAVALFYYAGHGLQVGGKNYLVPVDAEIKTELYVAAETVELNTVLGLMQDAKTRVNILIIDACRDNPFARRFRGVARGLAFMDAPNGTYVAYATAPGSVAEDGDPGQNSIYTGELIKVLREPGLRIEDVFKRVRVAVLARTNNRQNPWDASSLTGDFFLNAANPEEQRPTPRTVVWRWDHRSIPGPPSVDIRMPSADLPPVVGALSGVWDGAWDGLLASRLVVASMEGVSAKVIYAWADDPAARFKAGWVRVTAVLSPDGKLSWGKEPSFVFEIRRDLQSLIGQRVQGNNVSTVRMTKVGP